MALHLASTPEANSLLERDPLALLLGMLLDQQIPMEKAFTSPRVLADRLGVERLDAAQIAAHDPAEMLEIFRTPPALHRFPGAMAERTQAMCQALVERYDGSAEAVWADAATGGEVVRRMSGLPGFGAQKAKIFTALLGKRMGVRPDGWDVAAGDYGLDGYRSIADVVDDASRLKVRDTKKQVKAAARAAAGS